MSQEVFDKLSFFLQKNRAAVKLCIDLLFVGHLWDDLIDGDVIREPEEIDKAFLIALGELPLNPFYQANQMYLAPLLTSASLLWIDSNGLERGSKDERLTAFCIRNALLNVIHFCIFLVGGGEWVRQQGPDFWRTFLLTNEKYEELLKENGHA